MATLMEIVATQITQDTQTLNMYYTNLPKTDIDVNRLNFRLPDHTKIVYGSGRVKEYWEPQISLASVAWIEIEKLALLEGIKRSILIFAHNWLEWKTWADKHGLIIVPLKATMPGNSYSSYVSINHQVGEVWRCAVVRTPKDAAMWMDVWQDNDDDAIGELLGYPACCRKFFTKYWGEQDYRDITYPAYSTLKSSVGPPESNILGRWVGIRLVAHMPCSFNCDSSVKIGKDHAQVGRDHGYEKEVDLIYQLLNMPYKYSSLHGIATITTPLFKVSAASEPYATEVVFEKQGETPEMSSSGKDFPFNNEAKSVVTESNSFKRALDHYRDGGDVKEVELDKNYDEKSYLNGFSTPEAQQVSHQSILDIIPPVKGDIVDFGCGNGALLAKIGNKLDTASQLLGVDINMSAVDHGNDTFPVELTFNNLFQYEKTGELAIFMPGRFQESLELKENFIKKLSGFKYVILYAYSDWIDKIDFDSILDSNWIELNSSINEHCRAILFQNTEKL